MKGYRLGVFMGLGGRPGVQGWGRSGWPRSVRLPRCGRGGCCGHPGRGGGADGGGLVLDRYLQIYNTLIKNFFDHAFDC